MKRPPRFPRVDELPDGPRARRFLVAAFAFFALAVLAGGWLRVGMAWPAVLDGIAPFNLRNAHSHVAYFGWLSLAVMGAAYGSLPVWFGRGTSSPRASRWHWMITVGATGIAFVTFVAGGYWWPSLVPSTINLLTWYLFGWVIARAARRGGEVPLPARYLLVATAYLVIASVGVWTVSFATATQHAEDLLGQAGIAFYLHNFTEGWFVLALMGLVYTLLERTGRTGYSRRVATWQLALMAGLTLPGFASQLPPDQVPASVILAGRICLVLLAVPTALFIGNVARALRGETWGKVPASFIYLAIALAFAGLKVAFMLGAGSDAAVAWAGSFGKIAYLHVTLLGFSSAAALAVIRDRLRRWAPIGVVEGAGIGLYSLGALAMIVALVSPGLGLAPYVLVLAAIGGAVAVVGVLLMVGAILLAAPQADSSRLAVISSQPLQPAGRER